MAKFYTGQKVRIVKAQEYPELLNSEALVVGAPDNFSGSDRNGRVSVVYSYPIHVFGRDEEFIATEDELEPIIPEGLESPEAIEELYEPGPLKITVKAVSAAELYEPEDG